MLIVNKLIPQARGLAPVLVRRAARIALGWDVRQRSRFDATDANGRSFGVFLPRGSVVRGGDVLVAEDGSLIVVDAAAEPVLVVTPCPHHGSAFDLMRAAYHLGNRHVALELRADRLQLEPDHVLADLLRQMDFVVTEANAPFEPESGAYAASGSHAAHAHGREHATAPAPAHDGHDPHDGHDHDGHAHPVHGHSQDAHATAQEAPVAHVHGPDCDHGHASHR